MQDRIHQSIYKKVNFQTSRAKQNDLTKLYVVHLFLDEKAYDQMLILFTDAYKNKKKAKGLYNIKELSIFGRKREFIQQLLLVPTQINSRTHAIGQKLHSKHISSSK